MQIIRPHTERGFTLIELLIAMTIVALLVLVAIPSYRHIVMRGTRTVATAGLLDLANRQHQFHLNNGRYSESMTGLGYPADRVFGDGKSITLNQNQSLVAANSAERVYILSIDTANATEFTVSAVPQLGQMADTMCGTLTLDNNGSRTESGTGSVADCW